MSVSKIIIAALILVLGLTGAYLIILDSNSPTPVGINNTENVIENNPVGIELADTTNDKNLTNILTKKISDSIIEKNIEGLKSADGEAMISAPAPEQMIEDLIIETQKNFDPSILSPEINESLLMISKDNSQEALSEYFTSFANILISANEKMPTSINNPEEMNISDFTKIKEVYEYTVDEFYKITVPSLALDIHKKEIELLSIKKIIFEKAANIENDPVSALLVADELLKTTEEFDTLRLEIEDFIKTHLSN
jgi:hypothetical protein